MLISKFNIHKENKTRFIAQEISKICKKGDVLAISGSMGSGKSTFIRYFIRKISNAKSVPSPTYNIILPYETKHFVIYHMDVWRLKNHNEALSLGITEMFDNSVFLIEWAEKIKMILPDNSLMLSIKNRNNQKWLEIIGNESWKKRLKNINKNEKY